MGKLNRRLASVVVVVVAAACGVIVGGCGRRGELLGTIGGDAGPSGNGAPRFSVPQIVTALSDPFARDSDPTLTSDLLELYFASDRAGAGYLDIWTSKRATATDPWGTPTIVAELNSNLDDYGPAISLDGTRLWFASSRGFSLGNIWRSSRLNRQSPWTFPVEVPEVDAPASKDFSPAVDAIETVMMFSSNRPGSAMFDVYFSTRASQNAPWGFPRLVPGVNGPFDDWDPFVAQGGLVMFFTSMRAGAGDIFWSARQSLTGPFPPPLPVENLNSLFYESDVTLSPDLTYVLFDSNRTGNSEIYEAHSIP